MNPGPWIPYCGAAPDPAQWLGRWNFDPPLLVALMAGLAWGLWRAPQRRVQVLAVFALAILIFVSPLCALSSALFSARTVHHVLLVAVLAPLVAGLTPRLSPARGAAVAALVQAAAFWAWHAPGAYGWALSSDGAYWLMQASLCLSAVWFWSVLRGSDDLTAISGLLTAMVLMGLLGAVLVFAPAPLYAPHLLAAEAWGLGALRDQQLAGLIMWAPAAALYLAAALGRLGRRLRGAALA